MKKRVLIFDVDDVILPDRWLPWLQLWFEKIGRPWPWAKDYRPSIEHGKDKLFRTQEEQKAFCDFFHQYDSYAMMKPFEGAVDSLRRFHETDTVFLATAVNPPIPHPNWRREYIDKGMWIEKNLGFLPNKNIIFSSQKQQLHGHAMTDDVLENLAGNFEQKILFSGLKNRGLTQAQLDEAGVVRADTWKDITEILK